MTARALVPCGACGLERVWKYTAYWYAASGKRPVVRARPRGITVDGYLDDCAELVMVPKLEMLYVPLCRLWCGDVALALNGGWVERETAWEVERRDLLGLRMPAWYAAAREAAEPRRLLSIARTAQARTEAA